LFSILFALGMVAVAIATQVVVPALLRFLSLFFATRGLTAAADAVREAGEDAMAGINRSRRWFRGAAIESDAAADERVRVAADPEANVRVEPEPEAREADEESATEARKATR
jgi:hypothetical protein